MALQNLPVVFCVDRAGFVGADGPTHHGVMDIGFLRMLPNLVMTAPSNELEMKQALRFALAHPGPVVLRYPRDMVPEIAYVPKASATAYTVGQSVWMNDKRDAELVIVNYGGLLAEVLKAEEQLAQQGVDVGVVNARFVAPLDDAIPVLVAADKRVVTVEDHRVAGGFGSALLERIATQAEDRLGCVRVLGAPRSFMVHDGRGQQLMRAGTNADEIIRVVLSLTDECAQVPHG
ncbi:MAG: hypothetical protein MI922_18570 [Bacteroidales bacterium]|nr:hypothetical protein [Bacteroidales bacterium]